MCLVLGVFYFSTFSSRYLFYRSRTTLKQCSILHLSKYIPFIFKQWEGGLSRFIFYTGLIESFVCAHICNNFFFGRVKIKCNWRYFGQLIHCSICCLLYNQKCIIIIRLLALWLGEINKCLKSLQTTRGCGGSQQAVEVVLYSM